MYEPTCDEFRASISPFRSRAQAYLSNHKLYTSLSMSLGILVSVNPRLLGKLALLTN